MHSSVFSYDNYAADTWKTSSVSKGLLVIAMDVLKEKLRYCL